MISIRRLMYSDVAATRVEGVRRIAALLLEAIRNSAVPGEQNEHHEFQSSMRSLLELLEQHHDEADILMTAGSATRAMEEYNRRTSRYLRRVIHTFHEMLGMLTDTVARVSSSSAASVCNLQSIEKQLEKSAQAGDLQALKSRLAECLEQVRRETIRQKEASARAVTALRGRIQQVAEAQPELVAAFHHDPQTGLPDRQQAEHAIAEAVESGGKVFAAIFVVQRYQLVRQRYGLQAADRVFSLFVQYLAQQLSPADALFRWSGGSALALMERMQDIDAVRSSLERFAGYRLDAHIEVPGRTVILPVSCCWLAIPVFEHPEFTWISERLDSFAQARQGLE